MGKRTGLTEQIRRAAGRRTEPWRPLEIVEELGLTEMERHTAYNVVMRLGQRGELQQLEDGRYLVNRGDSRPRSARMLILRAMYFRTSFTSRQVQLLAGTGSSYTNNIIQELMEKKLINCVGKNGRDHVYMVADRDNFRPLILED